MNNSNINLKCGDCLQLMREIPDKSVDMILCDLPYGVLNARNKHSKAHDQPIPFESLWSEYERIIKPNRAIVLFAANMFTGLLMTSNQKLWKYNLVWKKDEWVSGFLDAKRKPLRNHEDICVFSKGMPLYNPQKYKVENYRKRRGGESAKKIIAMATLKECRTVQMLTCSTPGL